jgi:C-terminal processing protease CtpA/Prc
MSYQQKGLKRSILFISFTGEEIGLLGSGYYVKHPSIPLEKCITMLNLDMIGRLNNQALIIFGTGTSSSFDSLVQTHNRDSIFTLKLNKDGYGPSDNSSFYSKKIPILFFFTDLHQDYHRPTDTYEKLNYKGLQQVVRYIESIILDIDKMPKPPKYVAVDSQKPSNYNRQNIRVYVGTIPDFSEHTEGYKISGVREGSPAAKAGLQGGDVIVKFGKVEIKNIQDYTYAINEYKAGDIVIVLIKRRTEIHTMKVVLESKK